MKPVAHGADGGEDQTAEPRPLLTRAAAFGSVLQSSAARHGSTLTYRLVSGLLLASIATGCGAAVVVIAESLTSDFILGRLTFGPAAGILVALALASVHLGRGDWFHPFGFPLLYIGFTLCAPIIYIAGTGQELLGIGPDGLSPTLVGIALLTIIGVVAGLSTTLALTRDLASDYSYHANPQRLKAFGRAALAVGVAIRAYATVTTFGQPYGTGSVVFGGLNSLETLANFLFFVGVLLVTISNARLYGRIWTASDLALAACFVGAALLAGSRGELVAPIVFALWAHHTLVRPLRPRQALAVTLAIVIVFQGTAGTRADEAFIEGRTSAVERTLGGVGIPLQVTYILLQYVPQQGGFEHGTTYAAALERQLPGPIGLAVLGPPADTGTFVLRDLTGFRDPNAGLGFAFPAEAYLNFGLPGVLLAGVFLGALFGFAYKRQRTRPSHALHLLYPILIATLPLSFRADAVAQIKTVLYPMMLLGIVFWIARAVPDTGRRVSSRFS